MTSKYQIGTTVFDNWIIRRKLGEGSFGRVFEIEREDFGEVYHAALKVITVPQNRAEVQRAIEDGMTRQQTEQYFYSMVQDIVREFAIMAKLKGTANVVGYEDHAVIRHRDDIGWDILIRMELLTPLFDYARAHPFSRRDIIRLGIDMCRALELCQKYNIIHRDIKPENIFVSNNGDFKLGDFGIARTIERTMSDLSQKGTYSYMAPEVHRGTEYGFSVDIYSLGLVLYRLLNRNRLPFMPPAPEQITYQSREAALHRRLSGEAIPQPHYAEGRLSEIVLKACAFAPKDRYSSPAQMRQELEDILYDRQDAELIYPDGDGVVIDPPPAYVPDEEDVTQREEVTGGTAKTEFIFSEEKGRGRKDEPATESDKTEKVFGDRTENGDTTGKTELVFPAERERDKGLRGKPSEERQKKKPVLLIVLAAVLAAAIIGFVIYQVSENRAEQYQQLMDEGMALCETDPAAAGEKFLRAQKLRSGDAAAYTAYAYYLYCAGAFEDCISYIEDTLDFGQGYDNAEQNKLDELLGAAYFEVGDYAAAAASFRRSVSGDDVTVSAMRDYAVSLGRLGSIEEADKVLQRMFDAGASDDVTTYVQAEVDFAQDAYLDAESGFRSVLDSTEDIVLQKRSLRSLAEVYHECAVLAKTGQSPIASPAAKEVELLAWGIEEFGLQYDSTLWEMLALAYFEAYHDGASVTKDYLYKAAECFERVIELGVTKDYLYADLYTIYYELHDYQAAERALSDYENRFPNSYMPYALRSMMLITIENGKEQANRDYSAAKAEYDRAGQLLRSEDDTTYYQQLESLIYQLEREGWL